MDGNTKFLDGLDALTEGRETTAPSGAGGKIQYSSHPILKYRIGKFEFENSILTLKNAAEEAEFLEVINHENFPERERHRIKKLDLAAAESISRAARATRSRTTQQIDSSVGERPNEAPRVGIGDLMDADKKREELAMEAMAEGGREQNVPGAPDSNRETQTEPSPQSPPETPFRAEVEGKGGAASAAQLAEEVAADVDGKAEAVRDSLEAGKPADNESAPDVEAPKAKGIAALAGKPGLPKSE